MGITTYKGGHNEKNTKDRNGCPQYQLHIYDIECGYEAGCLGYSLYNQLTSAGVKCVILAPTTMLTQQGNRIKTDTRDALMIAQCLSYELLFILLSII